MNSLDFHRQLRETGSYETQPGVCKKPWKNGFRASYWVNWRLVWMLYNAGMSARKGLFSWARWAELTFGMYTDIESIGGKFYLEGFERLRDTKMPVVYVANHMSMLETMILPTALMAFGELGIVLKKSLLDVPIAGDAFRSKPIIALGRSNPREDLVAVLNEGEAILKSGVSLMIFPQGTRRAVFNPKQFNTIGVKLAERAGVPVVPIALRCDLLGVGKYTKDLGPVDLTAPVRIACGEPMMVERSNAKEVQHACTDFILNKHKAWGLPVKEGEHE